MNKRVFLALCGLLALTVSVKAMPGGWTEVDNLDDTGVQAAYTVASSELKAENPGVVTTTLTNASSQVVAGTNYELYMDAKDQEGNVSKWRAKVYTPLDNTPVVEDLDLVEGEQPVNPTPLVGGYQKADPTSDGVKAAFAATEARLKASELAGQDPSIQLKEAYSQIVSGTNYRILANVKVGPSNQVWEAYVFEPLGGGEDQVLNVTRIDVAPPAPAPTTLSPSPAPVPTPLVPQPVVIPPVPVPKTPAPAPIRPVNVSPSPAPTPAPAPSSAVVNSLSAAAGVAVAAFLLA